MSDRELLELAAKAAEIVGGYVFNGFLAACPACAKSGNGSACLEKRAWNPLTDDGDALRLAVKLNLNLEFASNNNGGITVKCYGDYDQWPEGDEVEEEFEAVGDRATRRAIVRAAAELGRTK